MPNTQIVSNVTPTQLPTVVNGFYAAGATNVQTDQQSNGNYTVTATFPAVQIASSVQVVSDVSPSQLTTVVNGFYAAGATSVHTTQQANGNYTVTATF